MTRVEGYQLPLVVDMKILDWLRLKVRQWLFPTPLVEALSDSEVVTPNEEILLNPMVRSAISRICQSASSVPLEVYEGNNPVSDLHPAAFLRERFNSNMTTETAVATIISDLILYGNSFWKINTLGKRVIGLDYLSPKAVFKSQKEGYLSVAYELGIVEVSQNEVVWFKIVNPAEPTGFGLPLANSILLSIRLLNEIDKMLLEYFRNGALPLAVLFASSGIPEERQQAILERIRSRVGSGKRYNWLILSDDFKIETINTQGMSPTQFVELRRVLREEILSCLNVPPAIVGIFEYANYANSREQTKIFWRETVIPYLRLIEETLTEQFLQRMFGSNVWCGFQIQHVDAVKESLADASDAIVRLVQNGILTINEARELLGFDEPLPWGNTWFGNISTVPIAEKPEEGEPEDAEGY